MNEIEFFADLGLGANTVQVIGSNAAEGVTGGEDGGTTASRVHPWDGLEVTEPDGDVFAADGQLQPDILLNLNSGLLTDNDADLWVVNQNPACVPAVAPEGGRAQQGFDPILTSDCFVWALDLQLGEGDNVVFLKGGDGTGFAICDVVFHDATRMCAADLHGRLRSRTRSRCRS